MSQEPLFTTRRDFLSGTLTVLSSVSTLPLFLGSTAQLMAQDVPQSGRKRSDQRILVVVQLAGGNDGLNTVVPYEMDPYYKLRPQIAIPPKEVLKLEDGVGLHPAAAGLKALFDDGRLAVVQGVGYPNPNRSHFTSMDIWHTADPELRQQSGWLGRYFDACCKGDDPAPEPIEGVALTQESPLAMHGERFMPLAFSEPDMLSWKPGARDPRATETFRKLNNISGDFPSTARELEQFLQRAALSAQVGADEIRNAARDLANPAARRGDGGRRGGQLLRSLRLVQKMIAADLPTRIYYVSMGGFDTHTGQLQRHRQLITELGDSLRDFVAELQDAKLLDRVMIMCFSEFGRRVQQNASGGTDHGEAAPMFLLGGNVLPGVHEKHPDLAKLHRGDLAFGVDFRRVYATVLQHWLNMRPQRVLGEGFAPLRLIKL
ncbi:MAG: hypothetical protein CHACPFDD_00068 [Phycisphaerae bacterium]|nr:hypothetical protein [Phycisphaerae bacterium]